MTLAYYSNRTERVAGSYRFSSLLAVPPFRQQKYSNSGNVRSQAGGRVIGITHPTH